MFFPIRRTGNKLLAQDIVQKDKRIAELEQQLEQDAAVNERLLKGSIDIQNERDALLKQVEHLQQERQEIIAFLTSIPESISKAKGGRDVLSGAKKWLEGKHE